MVFMGNRCEDSKRSGKTDVELLRMLDEIAAKKALDWLPFSKGGSATWEARVHSSELTGLTGEQVLLDMRRERTGNDIVSIHLFHATGEEILATGEEYLPCDVFRRYVKLPSCPESIRYDASSNEWVFKGIGEGHGFGLSVQGMEECERSGMTAAGIIEKAYLCGPDGRN
jgi:peptidoglycan hydrolase-like amidase